jgi:hypothetical protein
MLRYDKLVEDALRGVVRESLAQVAKNGLPGDHHFYLTFRTGHPGIVLPEHLRAQYPDEMTIVIQHQYWGLEVTEDFFEVTLSFNKMHERLHIPFSALSGFADPSVRFGLQFKGETVSGGAPPDAGPGASPAGPVDKSGQVVALDAFRKK